MVVNDDKLTLILSLEAFEEADMDLDSAKVAAILLCMRSSGKSVVAAAGLASKTLHFSIN